MLEVVNPQVQQMDNAVKAMIERAMVRAAKAMENTPADGGPLSAKINAAAMIMHAALVVAVNSSEDGEEAEEVAMGVAATFMANLLGHRFCCEFHAAQRGAAVLSLSIKMAAQAQAQADPIGPCSGSA